MDMRGKLTSLIRDRIEQAGLEMGTCPGKPTARGGYDTELMYAQRGTATLLAIDCAFFPGSAKFELRGPAVDAAPAGFWRDRSLFTEKNHGGLRCGVFAEYHDGPRIDLLLTAITALLGLPPAASQLTVLAAGLSEGDLDDDVHDAASAIGSAVNNDGPAAQVRFLVEQCGEAGAEALIRQALSRGAQP